VEFALFQNVNGVLQRPGQVRTGPYVGVGVEEDAVPERRRRGEQFAFGDAGIRTAADRVEDDGSIARERDDRRAGEAPVYGGVLTQQGLEERPKQVVEVVLADSVRPIQHADHVHLGARSQHRQNVGDVRLG